METETVYIPMTKPGTRLADSNNTKGAKRGNQINIHTGKPDGNAEFMPKKVKSKKEMKREIVENRLLGFGCGVVLCLLIQIGTEVVKKYEIPKKTKNLLRNLKKSNDNTIISNDNRIEIINKKNIENMTSEQAQKYLIELLIHLLKSKNIIERLNNANIYDESGKIITLENLIKRVNDILVNNPEILDDKEINELSILVGHNILDRGSCSLIKMNDIVKIQDYNI